MHVVSVNSVEYDFEKVSLLLTMIQGAIGDVDPRSVRCRDSKSIDAEFTHLVNVGSRNEGSISGLELGPADIFANVLAPSLIAATSMSARAHLDRLHSSSTLLA